MSNVEERVRVVEVRMDAYQHQYSDLRGELRQWRTETAAQFERIEARFAQVDARFAQVEARLTAIDEKFDRKFDVLHRDMTVQLRWIAGIMLSGFAAIVAAMIAG